MDWDGEHVNVLNESSHHDTLVALRALLRQAYTLPDAYVEQRMTRMVQGQQRCVHSSAAGASGCGSPWLQPHAGVVPFGERGSHISGERAGVAASGGCKDPQRCPLIALLPWPHGSAPLSCDRYMLDQGWAGEPGPHTEL